jgi:hypothetical protein
MFKNRASAAASLALGSASTIDAHTPTTMEELNAGVRDINDLLIGVHPSTVNVIDEDGNPLRIRVVQNMLTDGSFTYDIIVGSQGDRS